MSESLVDKVRRLAKTYAQANGILLRGCGPAEMSDEIELHFVSPQCYAETGIMAEQIAGASDEVILLLVSERAREARTALIGELRRLAIRLEALP